nr:helix-turn-helix transcriptional regulator [Cohnella sp. REN36]
MLSPIFVSFAKRYKLTTRETQVMKILVLEGKRNDDIASMLFISPKTLKNHLAFMMRKTGTSSARGLISLFFKHAMQILLPSV